jgi:hypothetical protein
MSILKLNKFLKNNKHIFIINFCKMGRSTKVETESCQNSFDGTHTLDYCFSFRL